MQVEAAQTANILRDIDKIEAEFINGDRERIGLGLDAINELQRYNNPIIAERVFEILGWLGETTRSGMTKDDAFKIFHTLIEWYLPPQDGKLNANDYALAMKGIDIGYSMAYDAIIHLRDLRVAIPGLNILKFFYMEESRSRRPGYKKVVMEWHDELRDTLNRPERTDLGRAKILVQTFRDDLQVNNLSYPIYPAEIADLMGA